MGSACAGGVEMMGECTFQPSLPSQIAQPRLLSPRLIWMFSPTLNTILFSLHFSCLHLHSSPLLEALIGAVPSAQLNKAIYI